MRLFPALLRIVALGTRFLFVFLLARYLSPEDVGLYGLVLATISFVIYPIGLDFYTYSTRQIIKNERSQWRTLFKSHSTLALITLCIAIPWLTLLFILGLLPVSLFVWFYLILVAEYMALELERALIAMSEQLAASVSLFIRQALLPLVLIPIFIFFPDVRDIDIVFTGWFATDLVAVILGIALILKYTHGTKAGKVDWSWIRKGILTSLPFLIGTLFLRFIFTADRQIVATYDSLAALGAYTVYVAVGTGIGAILGPAVHQFAYPALVRAAHDKDYATFSKEMKSLLRQSLALIIGISALALLGQNLFVSWVGGGVYADFAWVLPWILLVFGIYNLSLVPHYGLYALHADKVILWSTVAALTGFAIAIVAFVSISPSASVIAGIGIASLTLLVAKSVIYFKLIRRYKVEWSTTAPTPVQ